MPPDLPKGPCGPSSGHSHLLHLQRPLITTVIEIPEIELIIILFQTKI